MRSRLTKFTVVHETIARICGPSSLCQPHLVPVCRPARRGAGGGRGWAGPSDPDRDRGRPGPDRV